MVTDNHYRWDFIGLSTDQKPTPATSDKVVDGSTFYCSDTSKLYVFCKDTWYERKALGSGGGGTSYTAGTGIDITNDTISVDTDTIQEKLTAGSNVTISDNTISATDTTYSNFTGTDGTAAGAAGLVPAPATTDAGKFLKADGTWDTAGGGGDTVYSNKTTSSSNTGGAVYIGNLNSSQEEQPDPTTTDYHYKYFWALPSDNSAVPVNDSVNILGDIDQYATLAVSIGSESKAWGSNSVALGRQAKAGSNSVAIGSGANAGKTAINISNMISIGQNSQAAVDKAVCIGGGGSSYGVINTNSKGSVSLGYHATVGNNSNGYKNSVALGAYSGVTRQGEVNVGLVDSETTGGYDNTAYRVIGGVHDGVDAHDAATVAQGNTLATSAPTTSTVGVLGQLYTDTTNMHTYQCTAISGDTYTWTQRW